MPFSTTLYLQVQGVGTSSAKIPAVTARAERVVQERKITTMRFLVVVSSPPPFPLFVLFVSSVLSLSFYSCFGGKFWNTN